MGYEVNEEVKSKAILIFAEVRKHRDWVLSRPRFTSVPFVWIPLSQMVERKEGIRQSMVHLQEHYDVKDIHYEPYVRFALDHQLARAGEMVFGDAIGDVLAGVLLPVPAYHLQKELIDHFIVGEASSRYKAVTESMVQKLSGLELAKEKILTYLP